MAAAASTFLDGQQAARLQDRPPVSTQPLASDEVPLYVARVIGRNFRPKCPPTGTSLDPGAIQYLALRDIAVAPPAGDPFCRVQVVPMANEPMDEREDVLTCVHCSRVTLEARGMQCAGCHKPLCSVR